MTLVALRTPVVYPGNALNGGAAPALGNGSTLDLAGEYDAQIYCAQENMTLTHAGLKLQTATGSPNLNISIQTVDASGYPSGTNWATNTETGNQVFTTTYTQFALTASATITKGQNFAIVPTFASGTSSVLGTSGSIAPTLGNPYNVTNTSGAPVKTAFGPLLRNMAVGPSATTFYPLRGMRPAASIASNVFNNSSAGAKQGFKCTIPFSAVIVGIRTYLGTSVGPFNYGLNDTNNVELGGSATAFDGVSQSAVASSVVELYFDNPVTVVAGQTFYAYQEPTSTTNINMYTATLPTSGATAAQYMGAWPGGTTFFYATYTTAGGSWSDSTTQVPYMDLLIGSLDTGGIPHILGG